MALSTALIHRLDTSDEPLPKRLKLAENVFYSPDLPIIRKQDCIFRWLCSELSKKDSVAVWTTIQRCLSLEPKSFPTLSPETKHLLVDKLITTLNEYPETEVLEEILKCCIYIFSNSTVQSFSKENKIVSLIEAVLTFSNKYIVLEQIEKKSKSVKRDVVIECAEHAISSFAQICRQNFSEKRDFMIIFIENLLFPLASLVETLKTNNISSKVVIEIEKCIKRLMLGSIKQATSGADTNSNKKEKIEETQKDEKTENNESDSIFDYLRIKASTAKLEDIKAAFTCIFECAINTFQQNSVLVDILFRKLIECTEQKEHFKQVLISLLNCSADVSYNFDNEINGVSLKTFLKTQIEETISKKKCFKCSDYELLSAVAKLNPLIIEDITQIILERVLFENKISEKEEVAFGNLIKELWKASVRLRRHQKFISKFLLTVNNHKEREGEGSELVVKFDLPKAFIIEFSEDLKGKSTSAQIVAMFHTFIFHLKSDCVSKLKTQDSMTQVCLMSKIVGKLLVIFFENSNFLDSSLPHDWQNKFFSAFADLKNTLITFTENLCEQNKYEKVIFVTYTNMIKIWCEVYDLLHYYASNTVSNALDFPVTESQIKELKSITKKYGDQECEESLDHLIFYESVIYNRDNPKPIKEKIITQLWPRILKNHFETINSFDNIQILKLTSLLVENISYSEDNLSKWTLVLRQNVHRMTENFATAVALQIISELVKNTEFNSAKNIISKIDFENILKSPDDPNNFKKAFKATKKEILQENSISLNTQEFDKIKRNLSFLSDLPLTFLNKNIRIFLFIVLYIFEQELKTKFNITEFVTHLYLDLLRQNDIDILNNVSKPSDLINHFVDSQSILLKVFKLSLNNLSSFTFWEEFIEKEECSRNISSILLTCVDSSKSKASSNEHKSALQNLSLKLSRKIIKGLNKDVNDANEIAGLRISLKIILLEKKKLKDSLKKCVETTLKNNVVENPETVFCEKMHQEILQLSLIVLSQRENFDVSEDVIKKLCVILINNPDGKIFSHFLEILKDNEFDFFAKSLSNRTKESLLSEDVEALDKLITIWESLSRAEAKGVRSKSLCSSVNNLCKDLLATEVKEISSIYLLKICRAFVTSKRMIRLSEKIVDSIFVLSTQSLNNLDKEAILNACQEALGLCLDFLRSKTEFLLDRLPALTNLFKKIVQIILLEAKESDFSDEQMLRILAIDIEKFCTFFAKLKKDVVRISPYLIADLIDMSTRVGVLPSYLKVAIDLSISHLLSNCDKHAISFLSRALPTSTQQIFKTLYDNYIKYHKFTGKI